MKNTDLGDFSVVGLRDTLFGSALVSARRREGTEKRIYLSTTSWRELTGFSKAGAMMNDLKFDA